MVVKDEDGVAAALADGAGPNFNFDHSDGNDVRVGVTAAWLVVAEGGTMDCLQRLLEGEADPDAANLANGTTPLLQAVKTGRVDVCRLLLAFDASKVKADNDGCSPLWWAVKEQQMDCLRLLLAQGVAVDQPNGEGGTPLRQAARSGYVEGLRLLLESGADPRRVDNDGNAPLWWANQGGHQECVKLLLEAGAAAAEAIAGDLSRVGFKLRYLREFVRQCGGRVALRGRTTMDVVHRYVKPQTLAAPTTTTRVGAEAVAGGVGMPLCQQLQNTDNSVVGMATLFGTC